MLADLHAVDPQAVGLGDFGKAEGYLERQVRRWGSQWEQVRLPDDTRDADVTTAAFCSGTNGFRPAPGRRSCTVTTASTTPSWTRTDPTVVRAVLDWELSTLGDPLSDAALMCVYRNPNFDEVLGMRAAWTSPLLPPADDLAQRYARGQRGRTWATGTSTWRWRYFKLAIIAAGIDFRAREGGAPPQRRRRPWRR